QLGCRLDCSHHLTQFLDVWYRLDTWNQLAPARAEFRSKGKRDSLQQPFAKALFLSFSARHPLETRYVRHGDFLLDFLHSIAVSSLWFSVPTLAPTPPALAPPTAFPRGTST